MLLRALEEKVFLPVGGDHEVASDFQLLAGTNRDMQVMVARGQFRDDLLARINLWTFRLPGLRQRLEDIEPNVQYELEQYTQRTGIYVTFNRQARQRFLRFATSPEATWNGNFRDLNGAMTRMATLAPGGRITVEVVEEELARLRTAWQLPRGDAADLWLQQLLGAEGLKSLDLFDRLQLTGVLHICWQSRTLSEAGRTLFASSRQRKTTGNDADRLRKYLTRFGLDWAQLRAYRDAYTPETVPPLVASVAQRPTVLSRLEDAPSP